MSSILKANLSQKPPLSTPIKYAAAAALAVAPPSVSNSSCTQSLSQPQLQTSTTGVSVNTPLILSTHTAPIPSLPPTIETSVTSSPSFTHPSVTSPILSSSASVSQQPDDSFYSGQGSPALSETVPRSVSGPAATSSPQRAQAVRKGRVFRRLLCTPKLNIYIQSLSLRRPQPRWLQYVFTRSMEVVY